jgi:cellulose biosynthesis protein BcsQ
MSPKSTNRASSNERLAVAEDSMFSAASFAGVLAKAGKGEIPAPQALHVPPVVAFYGFRGGAGRTTALAHVAALLSGRQLQVVAVDLDLEAPGLHHILDCPEPEDDRGGLALLRAASMTDDDQRSEALRLAPHIVKSRVEPGAPIRVLPAGRLSERYLERLEDLGVPLWHVAEGPGPLQMLVSQIREELQPHLILLDCRTGLSGLSAAAVFHVADVVVLFVTLSKQALDGVSIFFKGIRAAKMQRAGLPELLVVPSMVPEGPDGRSRLDDWFVPELEARYAKLVLDEPVPDDADEAWSDRIPIVREGIEYRRGIALADSLRSDFVQRSAGAYHGLIRDLDRVIRIGVRPAPSSIDTPKILSELEAHANLKRLAFAEDTDTKDIVAKFIQPADFRAIVDRSAWYIVGGKGAGKTWMWQYLLSEVGQNVLPDVVFVAGHKPKHAILSASVFRELSQDKHVKLEQRQLYGSFWLLYAANRLMQEDQTLVEALVKDRRSDEKPLLTQLSTADTPEELSSALGAALRYERAGTFAEGVIRAIDARLLAKGASSFVLLYDGLDIGFGSDERSIEMRGKFVNGLVEAIEPLRGACRRIGFKLFLREDLFSEISIQNQSHLSAATVELKWEPSDIWALTLNLLSASKSYASLAQTIDPSAGPGRWPAEEERRQALLVPLWGDEMERGNKISTSRFIQRRTADGKDRLFPRTLVQLLAAAVKHQQSLEASPDRVLRSASVIRGYNAASEARVDDLRKEYVALGDYLDALKGRNPTGTESEITADLKKALRKRNGAAKARGAPAGSLHAGAGGWHKVITRLLDVGVLREYKRARGREGEKKYEISLLYRPGLGIKAFGV